MERTRKPYHVNWKRDATSKDLGVNSRNSKNKAFLSKRWWTFVRVWDGNLGSLKKVKFQVYRGALAYPNVKENNFRSIVLGSLLVK